MCCILVRPVLEDTDRNGYHEMVDTTQPAHFGVVNLTAVNIMTTFINTDWLDTSESTAVNLWCECACVFVGSLQKDMARLKVLSTSRNRRARVTLLFQINQLIHSVRFSNQFYFGLSSFGCVNRHGDCR